MGRWSVSIVAIAALTSCGGLEPEQPQQRVEMRTIENTPVQPLPTTPAATLDNYVPEVPLPINVDTSTAAPEGELVDGTDPDAVERQRRARVVKLPFAPAIAMDPVDGQKVSITPETPMVEYKGRIYYFNSTANRAQFSQSPDQYLTGALASY